MIGMQYKINLPDDYDMNTVRQRVADNGKKTDGFTDLRFKAYLIRDRQNGSAVNMYAPLYLWQTQVGMNQFIFDGFYDHILRSFGWQQIAIGVPLYCELQPALAEAKFVLEFEQDISSAPAMQRPEFSAAIPCLGRVLIYNPDKWRYAEFYFLADKPSTPMPGGVLYELLHLSQ